jgi:F-box interacting protein
MAPGNNLYDYDNGVSLTTSAKRQQSTTTSTTGTTLTSLPSELVAEILFKLPVKSLLLLKCACKSLNYQISDPKFAKNHLRLSTTCHHLIVSSKTDSGELILLDTAFPSLFSASRVIQKQLRYPISLRNEHCLKVCSCDGILCITPTSFGKFSSVLWNPSIGKSKVLPPLEYDWKNFKTPIYSFGYDHFIHNYIIVAVSFFNDEDEKNNEVSVHTLGTDHWRRINDFPFSGRIQGSGIFVCGTINWLAFDASNFSLPTIVSLDLEEESFQILPKPDLEGNWSNLGLLRDCLCIFNISGMFLDVWIMKQHGYKESWTKLYSVPFMEVPHFFVYRPFTKAFYISGDEQLLLDFNGCKELKFTVCNSKTGTLNIREIQNISWFMFPEVYVESLISP